MQMGILIMASDCIVVGALAYQTLLSLFYEFVFYLVARLTNISVSYEV